MMTVSSKWRHFNFSGIVFSYIFLHLIVIHFNTSVFVLTKDDDESDDDNTCDDDNEC